MNAVGIDVSKGKSTIAVMRPLGQVVIKPFEVAHTASELKELVRSLNCLDGDTRVIMESTGKYSLPIADSLHHAGFFVATVNPILIHQYGNNSVRRVKTDRKDALKIARYGLDNWADLRDYSPMDDTRAKLKLFSRQFNLYSDSKVALKNNLIALLDQSFPGVNALFKSHVRSDGHQKWVDFVAAFWHAECVSSLSLNAFARKYRCWCKRGGYHFSANKAADIHALAKDIVPSLPADQHIMFLITEAAAETGAVSHSTERFRAELKRLAESLPEYPVVMAMCGVGDTTGPQLMAEIGDVRRFSHKEALAAFAGVDPQTSQSGKRSSKSFPASKRGSPALRKTLFLVMSALLTNAPADDPVFLFLDKKRAEGKPYYVYMTAGANKFLRIYYARVKEYLDSLEVPGGPGAGADPSGCAMTE